MPRQTSEFRVVVASPLDINEERNLIMESLGELNRTLDIQGVSLKVIGWEEYTTPGAGSDAQDVVSRQILEEYDILIGLFGARLGTPTRNARSGTVDEIEKALARHDPAMGEFHVQVYFGERIEKLSRINVSELAEGVDYKNSLHERGVFYKTFDSKDELAREVRINVQRAINYYSKSETSPGELTSPAPVVEIAPTSTNVSADPLELGILDLQEMAESAIALANAAVNQMAALMDEISNETRQKTKELESVSAPNIPASEKKTVVNQFANFLKSKATQLANASALAKVNFVTYIEASTSLFGIGRTDTDPELFQKARAETIEGANVLLKSIQESRLAISSYRETTASFPRITIQFNQAKRHLLEALDESLAFVNETEASLVKFTSKLKSYDK